MLGKTGLAVCLKAALVTLQISLGMLVPHMADQVLEGHGLVPALQVLAGRDLAVLIQVLLFIVAQEILLGQEGLAQDAGVPLSCRHSVLGFGLHILLELLDCTWKRK